jgi:hypothetical protein
MHIIHLRILEIFLDPGKSLIEVKLKMYIDLAATAAQSTLWASF